MKSNTLQADCWENIPKRREYFPVCASGYISGAAFQKLRLALEPFAWLAQFEGGCLRQVLAVFGVKRQVMAEAFAAALNAYASSADDAEGHAQLLDALRPFAEGGESRDSYESLSMAADFRLARTLCLAARRELRQ